MKGKTINLEFESVTESPLELHVELWKAKANRENNEPESWSVLTDELILISTEDDNLAVEIPIASSAEFDGLALVITRIDSHERTEPAGAYSLKLSAK